MTTITITKDDAGKLVGFTENDRKWLGRWRSVCASLEPGELLSFDFKLPGNRRFHNLCMRLKRDLFEAQEKFTDFEQFRKWLYVGSGHVDWVVGPKGGVICLPGTFSDEIEVGEATGDEAKRVVFEKIKAWCRTGEPAARLWKHLNDAQRAEMVERILAPYEEQYA